MSPLRLLWCEVRFCVLASNRIALDSLSQCETHNLCPQKTISSFMIIPKSVNNMFHAKFKIYYKKNENSYFAERKVCLFI